MSTLLPVLMLFSPDMTMLIGHAATRSAALDLINGHQVAAARAPLSRLQIASGIDHRPTRLYRIEDVIDTGGEFRVTVPTGRPIGPGADQAA